MSHDPWVIFKLDRTIAAAGGLGILTIDARPFDDEHLLNGQIYLDYGEGFEEMMSIPFTSGTQRAIGAL